MKKRFKEDETRSLALSNERDLLALALALLDGNGLTKGEKLATRGVRPCRDANLLTAVRRDIKAGADPLGVAFSRLRAPDVRREQGATYTPAPIITSMLSWASAHRTPMRVVDPGAGSGRFLLAAARAFPNATLIGVEIDPVAAVLLRANVSVLGLTHRTSILVDDFRRAQLPAISGSTLFIGNPPYVRHHDISTDWKGWFSEGAKKFGIRASKLAGLHLHFFLRTLQLARVGDYGAFITSAEWLDVNYGSALRQLLSRELGGVAVHVLDPNAMPFADATTTGAITCFDVMNRADALRVRSVPTLDRLNGLSKGRLVPWSEAEAAPRWSILMKRSRKVSAEFIELGEICRVHRGQVTGANDIWIAGPHTNGLPGHVLTPTVTKAKDLLSAGDALADASLLRRVVNLPTDLDEFEKEELRAIQKFLRWAKKQGADQSYIAQHRRAWWAVGLKHPAPIVCTYMARRPPAFVRNLCEARHINIAHGIYPIEPLNAKMLDALAGWLRKNVSTDQGRTYAGGLTKFEPKELERIQIPRLEHLF